MKLPGPDHPIAITPNPKRVRVTAGGAPLATLAGQSACVPTGTPMLPVVAQTRVLAT